MVKQIIIISYKEIFSALKNKYVSVSGETIEDFNKLLQGLKDNGVRVPFEKEIKKIKKIKDKVESGEEIEIEESTMALRTANNFLSIFV